VILFAGSQNVHHKWMILSTVDVI